MAWIARRGTNYQNVLVSNFRDDMLLGMGSSDTLIDGGRRGQTNGDLFNGGRGDDRIYSHWGSDTLRGDVGHDHLISRSDAGEPAIAQDASLPRIYPDEVLTATNDTLSGGLDNDEFLFRLDINAQASVMAAHADMAGNIDWAAIVGESEGGPHTMATSMAMVEPHAPHHHWIEGIGTDVIEDFYRSEGDRIVIEGYSVAATITYADTNHDGRDDMSIITLTSDQAGMGPHHGDALGQILVYGDFVTMDDLHIDATVHHGAVESLDDAVIWTNRIGTAEDDLLRTVTDDDRLMGLGGNDIIIDGGRKGDNDNDYFNGGEGNDIIRSHWGGDVLVGGGGDDILVSRCDAGEPEIYQLTKLKKIYPDEPFLTSKDMMVGGLGADTFFFRLDLDARPKIVAEHTDDSGNISWHGVAGENRAAHLHWVNSIGTDTIRDFYRAEGDKIAIEGHTVQARITHADSDGDRRPDFSIINLRSNQGGAGSHNKDLLGSIRVYGDLVTWDDLSVNAGVHHGVAGTIDEFAIV